ncbi:nuclear transport factor 2 family protein [Nonomuraea sp. NPDC049709]|uniref:nuclear transport factor 2 family protein n=1 Tax=Nonomuraea sp. NPDC049709 TaxID=3154736 RepID=UPI00342837CC
MCFSLPPARSCWLQGLQESRSGSIGPESVTLAWQRLHEAFPEAQVVVEDMVVEGDTAAVRTSVHGISGQQSPTMLEIFRVHDGRIAELWGLSSLQRT